MKKIKILINNILKNIGVEVFKSGKFYFGTYHNRPKKADDVEVKEQDCCLGAKVAIVVQGGIKYEDDFTFETIKLYKKLYPLATIILSTWNTEDEVVIKSIEALGAYVVVNEFPKRLKGHASNNLQLISSHNGIKYAKKLGVDYVLKTRADQRIYGEKNITYFLKLLKLHPLKIEVPAEGRIVVCSNGCFKNRLYNVSDMLLFGKTNDILKYFSCEEDSREHIEIYEKDDSIEYSKKRPGEIYFTTKYLENLGFQLKWSVEDSLFFFKELFIIVDCSTIDWLWPKYNNREYRWVDYKNSQMQEISHKDWLNMQDDI